MSYTKLPTYAVKNACEKVIADTESYWDKEVEQWIQEKMTEKKVVKVVGNWFFRKKEYEFYTREEAEELLHSIGSEWELFTPFARIRMTYRNHYNRVKKLLKLANATQEEYMFISAEDFSDISPFY